MQKKWLSDRKVADRYGVSRATVWRWAKRGILPEPVQFTPGCTRWDGEQLEKRDAEQLEKATA